MLEIFVDADACPVKEETYKVALRYGAKVHVVSNSWIETPVRGDVEMVQVGDGFDEADDWIVEHAGRGDIVLTADIPLAARALEAGARVLDFRGGEFTEDTIGGALASRELLQGLREMGQMTGGPAPFQPRDRSAFLGRLDQVIQALERRAGA